MARWMLRDDDLLAGLDGAPQVTGMFGVNFGRPDLHEALDRVPDLRVEADAVGHPIADSDDHVEVVDLHLAPDLADAPC
jgi:hypothetical protein